MASLDEHCSICTVPCCRGEELGVKSRQTLDLLHGTSGEPERPSDSAYKMVHPTTCCKSVRSFPSIKLVTEPGSSLQRELIEQETPLIGLQRGFDFSTTFLSPGKYELYQLARDTCT